MAEAPRRFPPLASRRHPRRLCRQGRQRPGLAYLYSRENPTEAAQAKTAPRPSRASPRRAGYLYNP
jgi:hypothetical protein